MLEARTGTYLADVYQSSVFPIMNLVEKGLLAKYPSPEREGDIEALRDKEGLLARVVFKCRDHGV